MGVWIEIKHLLQAAKDYAVTPFMGVWIEIHLAAVLAICLTCHSLYGSVD